MKNPTKNRLNASELLILKNLLVSLETNIHNKIAKLNHVVYGVKAIEEDEDEYLMDKENKIITGTDRSVNVSLPVQDWELLIKAAGAVA